MPATPPTGRPAPELLLLTSPDWEDYELLDSGDGQKLERYGSYTFVRPEPQALWQPALPNKRWRAADAVFVTSGGESGGHWRFQRQVNSPWTMRYKDLVFQAHASGSRHMGLFPEQAAHWDWIARQVENAGRSLSVLNLFGYTGLASLAGARAGARLTHVDASKKAVSIARQNQSISGLNERPVRWLVDDAFKFVQRELRRGNHYDGLILDPPKFGRGPKGQVWELFESLPKLLRDCCSLLSERPSFVVMTAYAIRASALSAYYALGEALADLGGELSAGELLLTERSAGRMLSMAIFARWSA